MQAVVFDMDGLMFDTERIVQYSWTKAGMALINRDLGKEIYHTLGFNKKKRREYFIDLLGENFDFDTFQIIASFYYYQYLQNNGIPIKKGLLELLNYLTTSSSYKNTIKHLRQVHIEQYFDVIITGDQVNKAKPDPEIYIKACNQLNVDPQDAFALEDSYHGIISASLANLKPIFVPDLLKDSKSIDEYIIAECDSLLTVIDYLKEVMK